eukprot:XP_011665743.1 PREDICTED: calcium homeostasis endoplasmic reticulum protein [Strongylocentrotus purpuratus]
MEAVPQPPADTDLQNIIDKLANFVARNGTDFEMMTKEKQKNNPKFGFLFGGEYYNYYQYKVTSEQRSIQQQKDKLAQQQAIIQDVITQQSIQSAPWQPQIQQQQQLEEQIAQIEEQISQSEENLGKQKEVLLQQQNDQIESVLANSREKAVIGIATELDVNLSELDSRLQAIIDACTKDAISNGKQWIFSTARSPKHCVLIAKYLLHQILAKAAPFTAKLHLIYLINDVLYHWVVIIFIWGIFPPVLRSRFEAIDSGTLHNIAWKTIPNIDYSLNGKQWIFSTARSPKHCVLIAKYLLHQILAKAAPFTAKLHLIYLINDVLYHCTRRNAHDLQHALEDTVAPIFCSTHAVADEDQKGKLEKVLKLWGTNNYFDSSVMERLKNPAESLALYQGTRITENGEAIQQLHIASQSQLAVLQKQHNDYVVHMRQQQAQYQQQQQQQQQQQVQQQLAAVAVSTPLPQVPTPFSMAQQMPPQVTQQVTQSMQPQVVPQVAISTVSGFPPTTSEAQAVGSAAPPPTGQLTQNVSVPQGMLPGSDPMAQAMSSLPPGMPPQIGGQPPPPQMPPQLPAGLPPMDPSLFPGGFPPVFNPSVPPPNIRPPFPFPPGALPPNFTLPPNFDFSKPPPCFLPGMDFPPIPMPPIAAPPPAQDPNDPSLMPRVPYYDLPAGLMAPLVSLEDTDYNPLNHDDIRLPPPQAPSERLLAAVEAFYAPPSRDAPRNSEGWEQNGLFEFFKAKQKYSKLKKEREKENPKEHKPLSPLRVPANSDRSPSPTPPPAARQLTPPPKQESRRRFSSNSPSLPTTFMYAFLMNWDDLNRIRLPPQKFVFTIPNQFSTVEFVTMLVSSGMPPQIGGQPPTPQMPPQLPAGLPPMDPSLFPGGFPPVFNPSVPPPNIRPPFPFPPGALPPNFTLPPNFDFSKPPPCFLPGMDFPPIPMPPIAAPPPAQDPNDPSLMPRVPYYDLPAGLMAPLVSLEDTDYNPLDHDDIRLPPPQAPSERLLAAVEAFYAPPSRDAPRNSEGWEQNGLFEFFKAKQKYSKLKKEREKENPKEHKPLSPLRVPANSDRSPSPTPPPAARQLTPPPKQESRRRFRSRSRSLSRSPSPSPARSPPRRSRRSRTRSRSRSPPPSRFFRRTSRSKSRSKSRSPPPSYRRESKREPSPTRESKARSPTKRSPSPTEDYGVQPFYQMHVDVKLGEDNKGHQLMKKMGWTGQGLGAKEQGIVNPIASGDVRHDLDKFKGIGMDINDPFESFRKSKSYTYNRRK